MLLLALFLRIFYSLSLYHDLTLFLLAQNVDGVADVLPPVPEDAAARVVRAFDAAMRKKDKDAAKKRAAEKARKREALAKRRRQQKQAGEPLEESPSPSDEEEKEDSGDSEDSGGEDVVWTHDRLVAAVDVAPGHASQELGGGSVAGASASGAVGTSSQSGQEAPALQQGGDPPATEEVPVAAARPGVEALRRSSRVQRPSSLGQAAPASVASGQEQRTEARSRSHTPPTTQGPTEAQTASTVGGSGEGTTTTSGSRRRPKVVTRKRPFPTAG